MALIVNIKRQRAVEWEKIIEENNESFLAVSTIDVLIMWRAGEIKGYANHVRRRYYPAPLLYWFGGGLVVV